MSARVTQQVVAALGSGDGGLARISRQIIEVLAGQGAEQSASSALNFQQFINSAARVTQQSVESLSDGQGKARVTFQVIEALGSDVAFQEGSGSNSLLLTQDAIGYTLRQSVESTMALVSVANLPQIFAAAQNALSNLDSHVDQGGVAIRNIASVLSLQQTALPGIYMVSAESTLALVDDAYRGRDVLAIASSAMEFSQSDSPGIFIAEVLDILALAQAGIGDTSQIFRVVPLSLALTQAVSVAQVLAVVQSLPLSQVVFVAKPIKVSVASVLSLSSIPDQHQAVANVFPSHFLDLHDQAGLVYFVTATTPLELSQNAFRRHFANSLLALTSTALGVRVRPGLSEVTFNGTATRVLVALRTPSSVLEFDDSAAAYLDESGVLCNYMPFVGAGLGAAPSTTAPTIGHAQVRLTYPYVSPSLTLDLRNPDFGNQDRLSFDRINRETRGGTLIMFVDPDWPKQTTLNVTINALRKTQVDSLLSLLHQSVGKEVGYRDHENRQWRGIIITPEAVVTQEGKDQYRVTFEFEGALA